MPKEHIVYRCFNCNKTFRACEMKYEEVNCSNFSVNGQKAVGVLQQCPHCNAVAIAGFNAIKVKHKEISTEKDKRTITICDEDIMNLKMAIKKLRPMAVPYVDLEILTIGSIIERYNTSRRA